MSLAVDDPNAPGLLEVARNGRRAGSPGAARRDAGVVRARRREPGDDNLAREIKQPLNAMRSHTEAARPRPSSGNPHSARLTDALEGSVEAMRGAALATKSPRIAIRGNDRQPIEGRGGQSWPNPPSTAGASLNFALPVAS